MHIESLFHSSKANQNLLIYSLLYCKPESYSSSFILFCITLSITLSLFGFRDYYTQASLKSTINLPHTTTSLPTEKDPKLHFHSQTCITNLETISQSDWLYKPLWSDLTLWDGAHTVLVPKQGHLCTSIWLGPQEGASTFLLPVSGLTELQGQAQAQAKLPADGQAGPHLSETPWRMQRLLCPSYQLSFTWEQLRTGETPEFKATPSRLKYLLSPHSHLCTCCAISLSKYPSICFQVHFLTARPLIFYI